MPALREPNSIHLKDAPNGEAVLPSIPPKRLSPALSHELARCTLLCVHYVLAWAQLNQDVRYLVSINLVAE